MITYEVSDGRDGAPPAGVYRTTRERISRGEDAMRDAVASLGKRIPDAVQIGDHLATLLVKSAETWVAVKLPSLEIKTHWLVRDGKFLPAFLPSGESILATKTWKPPSDTNLWLAIPCTKAPIRWKANAPILWLHRANTPGFFHPPLPNLYADGRICLGRGYETIPCDHLGHALERVLEILGNNPWGNDLLPASMAHAQRFFGFDMNGVQAALPNEWWAALRRVNHPVMEEIVGS